MRFTRRVVFASLLSLAARGTADPTWPASTDEIEEIVYQLNGFRGRLFGDVIQPCTTEASGPGRQNAAEWLRTAFHDMATANTYFGTGGLDASLQFELTDGENTGPGHNTTLKFYSTYFSKRATMSDLIAAGVYASVRSCGGPIVPLRLGRVDATSAGSIGVPQPQNSQSIFISQFQRMGFNTTEMIQVTACGHTLGGVHTTEFPDLVPAGTGTNGEVGMDSSVAVFDNKIAVEYVAGNTTNPLVVGPSVAEGHNSDTKVNTADGNVTITTLTDPAVFTAVCQRVLQKMIEVVPPSVTLTTTALAPYFVKPHAIQLTLNSDGSLGLSGWIRIKTTNVPVDQISSVTLVWKDRNGNSNAGSTTATVLGAGTGLDDSFGFFPLSQSIPAATGISSFTVTINYANGTTQLVDNNGVSYPLQDAIMLQKPQSCLLQSSGALTVSAFVRNDRLSQPVNLTVSYLVPRNTKDGNPVPALKSASIAMTPGACYGSYTLYSASYNVSGGLSYLARLDVTSGSGTTAAADTFKVASDLAGTCQGFSYTGYSSCSSGGNGTASSSSSSASGSKVASSTLPSSGSSVASTNAASSATSAASSVSTASSSSAASSTSNSSPSSTSTGTAASSLPTKVISSSTVASSGSAASSISSSSSTSSSISTSSVALSTKASSTVISTTAASSFTSAVSSSSSSPSPSATLGVKQHVGGYTFLSCWTEDSGVRALSGASFAYDGMTLESCAANCTGWTYWGAEYGRECYCGNSLAGSSQSATLSDCNMKCGGNPYEYCGAGNRLELYSTTASASSTAASPTASLAVKQKVGNYSLVGCWTEGVGTRALAQASYASDSMTLESCAAYCAKYRYFGTEYSRECYCGDTVDSSASSASPSDCDMSCAGNTYEYCGGPSRLELYVNNSTTGPSQPLSIAGGNWTFHGCETEATSTRALSAASYVASDMTLNSCASYCMGYKYFGVEYGDECYCGNTFNTGSVAANSSECNFLCAGDNSEYCGAGNRLSSYVWNGS